MMFNILVQIYVKYIILLGQQSTGAAANNEGAQQQPAGQQQPGVSAGQQQPTGQSQPAGQQGAGVGGVQQPPFDYASLFGIIVLKQFLTYSRWYGTNGLWVPWNGRRVWRCWIWTTK